MSSIFSANSLKHLTSEQLFSLNERLMISRQPKTFDASKIHKLVKNLRKSPQISDAALLSSYCSEETFMRNMQKLKVHHALMEIIDNSTNPAIQQVLLFGLAELALDMQACKEMISEGLVIPFFLKYLESKTPVLVCYSIKALTTLLMSTESIGMLINNEEILKIVLSQISNEKVIFKLSMEIDGKGVIQNNESTILGNTMRFLVTLGQIPVIRRKMLDLGVLKKLKSLYPTQKIDIDLYHQALTLFEKGKLVDLRHQKDAQKAMEQRIGNPSEMKNEQHCSCCGKLGTVDVPLSTCGGCKKVKYCNKDCQSAHWKQHKIVCDNEKKED